MFTFSKVLHLALYFPVKKLLIQRNSILIGVISFVVFLTNFAFSQNLPIDILVVGGGGGAGYARGGGGGGGGYRYITNHSYASGTSTAITIGAGGAKGTAPVVSGGPGVHALSGANSSFGSTFVSIGGGGGGSYEGPAQNGYAGGSGGGGANQSNSANTGYGGSATAGQGNIGGNSRCGGGGEVSGGGGGGAGGVGTNGTSSGCGGCGNRPYNPGNGGNGLQNSISGTAVWYAGGGGGGGLTGSCSNGANAQGTNGLGGGQSSYGGGGQCKVVSGNFQTENGGQGIVIIRYLGTPVATGGTITQVGGYTIHTFTVSGTFTYTATVSFNIQPSSTNQTYCLNDVPAILTANAIANLGTTPTYQWYSNTIASNTGGTLISVATSSSYTPLTNVSGTKYYYVVATNNLGSATSSVSGSITVSATSFGGTASSNQTICSGTQPANITLSGNTGTIQWQVSTDNNSFTNISGATATTLTSAQMGAITSTRYYRAVSTNSPCSAANSNVIIVTVTALPTITSTTPASICGSGTTVLGANAASGTINWYTAASGGSSLIAGTSYTTPSISATTTYYVDVTANGCTSSPRTAVIATVNALPSTASNNPTSITAEVLVVGGGGSGGFRHAGGGGGGGVVSQTGFVINAGNIPVTIGNGGVGSSVTGENSTFSSITAYGGGGGGNNAQVGKNGGSGGGGSNGTFGGSGVAGQGFKGGNQNNGNGCCFGNGAGGGGAGAAGANTTGSVSSEGGIGLPFSISGTTVYYGAGGGGGTSVPTSIAGGIGGGGAGGTSTSLPGVAGTTNTGGGGGGGGATASTSGNGGNGGSGIVIIRYPGTPIATGGTITQSGGFTIHKFTASGTFALTASTTGATIPNITSCGASAVTFTGTVSAGLTLDWYDAATGGNLLSQGTTSYTTPIISTTTTYYVAVRNSSTGCVSATRLAVTATINSASTVTPNQTICMGATPANIAVTSASGTIQWQSSTNNSTFTNISGQTGATLPGATIGVLYSTMYYRAVITNGACVGNSPVHTITVSNPTISATPVSTDLVWTGKVSTDWTNASNWLSYNGTTYGVAAAIPSNTTNVFIQGTNVCVLNQPTITASTGLVKNITIETGATLTMTTGELIVKGNWVKNGTFTAGTGMVTFNGTTAQSISGSSGTLFANLTVNNTSTGLTLNTPVTAKFALTMTAGNITTSTTNILLLGFTVVGTLNWTSGTIVGPFRRYYANATNSGNSSGLFPVGTVSDNRSALLEYTTAPTSAGYLTVQFKAINPTTTSAGTNGLTLTDQYNWQLDNIATDGYWEISTGMVGGNYNLTLRPKGFTTIGNTFDVCRIIKSPNTHTTWTLDGVHGTTSGTQSDFTISRTGMSGFSYFAIAYPTAAPLPVELISFQANCIDNKGVALTWSTASEHNSANFTVEKSRDGINWSVLSTLAGAGNSTSILNYEIVDADNANGTIYYRLTQFDFDGASETFNIASVNCGSDNPSQGLKVYPNPSSDEFYIEYNNTTSEEQLELMLSDLNGNTIYLENKNCEKGSNTFQLKNLTVAPGIYFIQVRIGETISRVKHSIR